MRMGQHQRRLLTIAGALFCACVLFGAAATGAVRSDKQKGLRNDRDSAHPRVDSDLSGSHRESSEGRRGIDQEIDLTNIKRVLAEKRSRNGDSEDARQSNGVDSRMGRRSKDSSLRDDVVPAKAGIQGTLSERGLEYVKELLMGELLEEVTPLKIPDINARVNSPIGRVDTSVTDIVLSMADVYYSDIDLGQHAITIYAAGIRATLEMHWEYHYTASYVPFPIGDGGRAEVKVNGMQAGVSLSLVENNGTLSLIIEEAGTYIEDLVIIMHGGASWLYQWFVYAFDYNIRAAIEVALTQQIVSGAEQLDAYLLHLPRAFPIDETSAIDVTVVENPILSPSYLSVGARGQFVSLSSPEDYPDPDTELPAGLFCDQSVKMLTIALSDYVLNSAAFVYYDSGELIWDVDTLPGKKYLNTASWRYIIPQLYKKYPNEDMVINFAVSSAPTVDIGKDGIQATAGADMTIEVKDGEGVIPVACINLMVSFDAVASLYNANITGEASLNDLTLSLKWSDIGSFPLYLVQATVRTIVKEVVLPLINLNLKRGFPLPVLAGVEIEDADLRYEDGYLLVCTDVHYQGGFIKELKRRFSTPQLHGDQ